LTLQRRLSSRRRYLDYLRSRREILAARGAAAVESRPRAEAHRGLLRLLGEFWALLRGNRATLAAALALLTVAKLLQLAIPASTKFVIDYVVLEHPLPDAFPAWLPWPESRPVQLAVVAATVLALAVVATFVQLAARWRATITNQRTRVRLRRRLFEHAARLPLHKVQDLKSGGAASLLREDTGAVSDLVFNMLFNPFRAVVQLLGGLAVLLWVDARLLLGALAVLPIVAWNHRLWVRWMRPLHRDIKRLRQEIDGQTTEVFAGMRIVRAFGRQRRESARFVNQMHLMSRQEMHVWGASRFIEAVWDLLTPTASGLLLLYGGVQVLNGGLTPGDLMMFLVYLAMLLEPIAVLATSATDFQSNLAAFDRILDVFSEPRELSDSKSRWAASPDLFRGPIRFEGVSFRYPRTDVNVLCDVNLQIEPGERVALVGRSGAGKTTLCNLVARFYDPTEGRISLSGVDLRDVHVETYRRYLGIVEQDVFLFDGAVADNIAYAVREATLDEIERAARVANAHEFIEKLPNGYETHIGERGVRLSGGQRQRIAIARAVLADPKIFILDEATSNLDTESERLIQESLAALMHGRTCIVIAHRLSTVRNADRILVMESGRIVEIGSHAELMRGSSLYREMVELQEMETLEASGRWSN
jgi:ATP-binding cassette subfamily B protein/subfamily B ATP-binding cassette protein MsbA